MILQHPLLVGLSGQYSNYKIILEKVNQIKITAEDIPAQESPQTDLSYDPNSIVKSITQHQKHDFTEEEINGIVSGYQNGKSTYTLAKKYNCHRSTISRILKKNNVTVAIEKINIQEAIKLYESGLTIKEVAAKYHMATSTVRRRLKEAGVKMRN